VDTVKARAKGARILATVLFFWWAATSFDELETWKAGKKLGQLDGVSLVLYLGPDSDHRIPESAPRPRFGWAVAPARFELDVIRVLD